MKFIDIHCHLSFPDYADEREKIIEQLQAEEIGVINVGVAHKYPNMWATVGVHPTDSKIEPDYIELEKLARNPKCVAIGECGLDYHHGGQEDYERQRKIFIDHINLANKVGKPLMLHVRNGKENVGAYKEAVELLKQYSKVRANFHFFAGSLEDLKLILEMGNTVSFTGVVTFAKEYAEIVKNIPDAQIMSETDAPFAAPVPYRGKRNNPLYIKEIVAKLADIREVSSEALSAQIIDNARRVFGI